MTTTKLNIIEALNKIDEESAREDWELWGNTQAGIGSKETDLFKSQKFQEIVHILVNQPILVGPTLNWLYAKQAQIARAQLEALYTKEQLEEMYENA